MIRYDYIFFYVFKFLFNILLLNKNRVIKYKIYKTTLFIRYKNSYFSENYASLLKYDYAYIHNEICFAIMLKSYTIILL